MSKVCRKKINKESLVDEENTGLLEVMSLKDENRYK